MIKVSEQQTCPITNSNKSIPYFSLGSMPLVNNLCDTREAALACEKVPLDLLYYPDSKLTALSHFVDSSTLFQQYLYKSSVNTPYISHCRKMYKDLLKEIKILPGDLLVDIGGNDGTLLQTFKQSTKQDLRFLNIDGSKNLVEVSKANGIDALPAFFNENTPNNVKGKAKIIISTNVFQHLQDINSFVKGIKKLLIEDGVWVLEFPYWLHDMETRQFDQVYHEHMYYYLVHPLHLLFKKHGLQIIKVSPQKIHGGTLRLYIAHSKNSSFTVDKSVETYLENESKLSTSYYQNWSSKIQEHITECKAILTGLKAAGKTLVGFAASAKGCIFLNSMGITDGILDSIIDDTDIKQGKFMPGTGIEIKSRAEINFEITDFILILSHNFTDHIITSLRDEGYEGKFIVCLPDLKII